MIISELSLSKTKPGDIILLLVLALAPLFKGLYYEQQMLGFQVAVFIAFLLFLVKNRSLQINHPLDYAAAAFALGYLLSVPGAADVREALLAFMRVLAGIMIYVIISGRAMENGFRLKILVTVYLSGFIALIGTLLNLTGVIETAKVWDSGVIQTTFEYKNAGALFLLICILLGVNLINNLNNLKHVIFISCVNFLNILFLLGTQSRAVWLLSPVCLLIVIWSLPTNSRLPALIQTIITAIPALILSGQIISSLNDNNSGQAIVLMFLGLCLTAASIFLWHRWGTRLSNTKLVFVVVAALFFIIAAVIFAVTSTTSISEKLHNITNFDFNAQERMVFFHDAFKIFTQHPIFGAGGKGWDVLYLNTQSYGYYAENVHNDFLQIAVEAGIVGLLPFLFLWATFFVICIRFARQNNNSTQKQIVYLLLAIGTAMFVHFMFDFDLAHGAIAFIMWILFGLARSYAGHDSPDSISLRKPKSPLNSPVYIGIIVSGILFSLVSLSFLTGDMWFSRGEKVLQTGDLAIAREDFEKALSFDPWKANTLTSLAQINLALLQNNGDPASLDNALSYAAKSIAIRPSEPLTHSVYSTALLFKGDLTGAVREAEAFTKLHPMLEDAYEQLAYTNLTCGLALAKKGSQAEARAQFSKTLEVIDMINDRLRAVPPHYLQMWQTSQAEPVLSVSPMLKIYAGAAELCLGNRKPGEQLITQALQEAPQAPEVQSWNVLALKLQGKESEARALLDQVSAQDPGFVQIYNEIIATLNR